MANAAAAGSSGVPAPRASKPAAKKTKAVAAGVETPVESQSVPVAETILATTAQDAHQQIAKIAYGYWAARGFHGGSQVEDWLRAEQEYYGAAR